MLVTLSFAVNHFIHGFSVFGYHLVNIFLHGLNGILVYLLLQHLSCMQSEQERCVDKQSIQYIAWAGAFLFLIHPVAVHSVTYITQRHGLMATFFYLSGFLSYLKARKSYGGIRAAWSVCLIVCFWSAMHSKPMALTLPLVLVAYELILVRREIRLLRRMALWSVPLAMVFAAILAGYALQSGLFSEKASLAGFRSPHLWSPWEHMLTESLVFLHYWKILFLPLPGWLSADHYYPVVHSLNGLVLGSWLVHILILGVGIASYMAGRQLVAFGISWFYLTLVPPYFVLPIQDVMVDYKTYLPSVGVACIMAEGGRYVVEKLSVRVGTFCLIVLGGLWCLGTFERNQIFETQESFWTDVIRKYPLEARPYNNRGLAYHRKGEYEKAILEFKRAISLSPDYDLVHANIGDSYREIGDTDKALEHYQKYVKLRTDDGDGIVRLANIYARQGNWTAAVNYYEQAVKKDPKNSGALYNLGLGLGRLGRYDQALSSLQQVVRVQPRNYKALAAIGAIHFQRGEKIKAKDYFSQSLAIEPMFPDALYNLAAYYAGAGQMAEARNLAERLSQVDSLRGKKLLDILPVDQ